MWCRTYFVAVLISVVSCTSGPSGKNDASRDSTSIDNLSTEGKSFKTKVTAANQAFSVEDKYLAGFLVVRVWPNNQSAVVSKTVEQYNSTQLKPEDYDQTILVQGSVSHNSLTPDATVRRLQLSIAHDYLYWDIVEAEALIGILDSMLAISAEWKGHEVNWERSTEYKAGNGFRVKIRRNENGRGGRNYAVVYGFQDSSEEAVMKLRSLIAEAVEWAKSH